MNTNKLTAVIIVALIASTVLATPRDLAMSIYHDNYALIRDTRPMDLTAGVNEFRFTDVAATIDATSVRFKSLDDPNAWRRAVLRQRYAGIQDAVCARHRQDHRSNGRV